MVICYSDGMFTMNDEDIKQLESDLKTFAIRAYPFATKNTVNRAAFTTESGYRLVCVRR